MHKSNDFRLLLNDRPTGTHTLVQANHFANAIRPNQKTMQHFLFGLTIPKLHICKIVRVNYNSGPFIRKWYKIKNENFTIFKFIFLH